MQLEKHLAITKKKSLTLAQTPKKDRDNFLRLLSSNIKKNVDSILSANKKDIGLAKKKDMSNAFINRLSLDKKAIHSIACAVLTIAKLPDVLGKEIEKRRLSNGILLKKITVPLGVIGVIYESRPNVTVDVVALCIKSGNVVVLKGGSDAIYSNRALYVVIKKSLEESNLPKDAVLFLDTTNRSIVKNLLKQNRYIDVVIPRGGYGLVNTIVDTSSIPVLYHGAGGARIYVDKSADLKTAVNVCLNAKTSRPATCNSLDTIIVHQDIASEFIPVIIGKMKTMDVVVVGDESVRKIVPVKKARQKDWKSEYLSLKIAITIVDNIDAAIEFIRQYTKNHSEGIIAHDKVAVDQFVKAIDSAAIFVNCSTRFHDGGEFGLGAEIGIATGKLHARGPVGLQGLTTYKWVVVGSGQVRN